MYKNCVISAVGRNSLHKKWIDGECNFDLHLIVYDDSMDSFLGDTPHVCHIKGHKLKVIHEYLSCNPQFLEMYDYFFFPDDDILMGASMINSLFSAMRSYRLEIAQPALESSYFTWPHTLRNRYARLRYTNFVEMMVPCFSRKALSKVLFTFAENETGWGTETHWPLLIGDDTRNMAVIDEIGVVHTRPIQSGQARHRKDLDAYLKKYGLETKLYLYDWVPAEIVTCCGMETFVHLRNRLENWVAGEKVSVNKVGEDGCLGYVRLLFLLSRIAQNQNYADFAHGLLEIVRDRLGMIMDDMTSRHGITGCCCLVEFLAGNGLIEDAPQDLLEDLYLHMDRKLAENEDGMSFSEIVGIGKCRILAYENRQTDVNLEKCKELASRIGIVDEWNLKDEDCDVVLDAMDLLEKCGVLQVQQIRTMERRLSAASLGRIGRAYLWFRLYLLSRDTFYLIRVQEAMKNLRGQLLTLPDALRLAEIMFYEEKCRKI